MGSESPGELIERWRMLLPEQRQDVIEVLFRGEVHLSRCASRARAKRQSSRPPWRDKYAERTVRHASAAGACALAQAILKSFGGHK